MQGSFRHLSILAERYPSGRLLRLIMKGETWKILIIRARFLARFIGRLFVLQIVLQIVLLGVRVKFVVKIVHYRRGGHSFKSWKVPASALCFKDRFLKPYKPFCDRQSKTA